MRRKDREKWNRRYREEGRHRSDEPSRLLVKWEPNLPPGGSLDVACGSGRNALFLASRGYSVDAIDYSEEALKVARERARKRGLEVNWILADLDKYELPSGKYDVIIVAYYHPQNRLPMIKGSLKEGGFILYEHHISSEDTIDRGPRHTHFRFEPNELLKRFSDLQVLHYEEGIEAYEGGDRSAIARIVARKTDDPRNGLPPIGGSKDSTNNRRY